MSKCKKGWVKKDGICVKKNYSESSYRNNPVVYNISLGGTGFIGLITIAFIILKLIHVINWSWWIVLSPLWGSVVLSLLIYFVAFFIIKKIFMRD